MNIRPIHAVLPPLFDLLAERPELADLAPVAELVTSSV